MYFYLPYIYIIFLVLGMYRFSYINFNFTEDLVK